MKVAIVRGASLSKWDMQIYEPLAKRFDLVGIGSKKLLGDNEGIVFPIKKLICPLQYFSTLPKFIPACFHLFGDANWLWGFSQAVVGCGLIHAVELTNAYSLQAVRAKKQGLVKAVTLAVYENIPFVYDEYARRREIKKEVVAGADHFLAVNEMTREMLLLEGVKSSKISIVPQSVDTSLLRPFTASKDKRKVNRLKRKLGIKENDFVVLRVGRMVWEKGWYDIVRAAHKIKISTKKAGGRNSRKIKFLFIGKGQEKTNLEKMVQRLNLEDMVVFAEPVPYRELADIYRLADVFIQSSLPIRTWQEQLGTVVIEAMASGLPIIGTLSGATPDAVGKEGGIFVQPQDFIGMAEAVGELYMDVEKRRKMGVRNRSAALKQYDNKVVAEKIRNIWEGLIKG
jgi:glycosyltransferase involved in cell wall biosynthesis